LREEEFACWASSPAEKKLLVAQGANGIQGAGADGGDQARKHRHCDGQRYHAGENEGIRRALAQRAELYRIRQDAIQDAGV
jgi:hypothetical protein